MRLTSLKLSGFKSFAEPVQIQLPGNIIGIVGPNGCGKSNLIDAVRWVLGESRASELRGETMQDVIFNGTASRKLASRASVEMIFDNSAGRAGGAWSQYQEIAVRRVMTRDGASSYYLNNQLVRRRDVQDLFLGTGLGPRAYAIIGQGMISRIIESRPEDIRFFLEEAAGVSKYKERRQETETRLRDTRENLLRVEDIRRELGSNLEKLETQAEAARRYRALGDQSNLCQQQIWFLGLEKARADAQTWHLQGAQAAAKLEEGMAHLRAQEANLERLHAAQNEAAQAEARGQELWHSAGAEVSRIEAQVHFALQSRRQAQARQETLQMQQRVWQQRREEAEAEQQGLGTSITQAEQNAAALQARSEQAANALPALEAAAAQAREQTQAQMRSVAALQQEIQVLAARRHSLEENQQHLQERREKLAAEQTSLTQSDQDKGAQLSDLQTALQAKRGTLAAAKARLDEASAGLPALDLARRERQSEYEQLNTKRTDQSARHETLIALQEKLQTHSGLQPWLQQQGLQHLAALWRSLRIQSPWESALEATLHERLQALPLPRLDAAAAFSGTLAPPARLAFYELPSAPASSPKPGRARLLDLLQETPAEIRTLLTHWLGHTFTAKDLREALARRAELQSGEQWVTPQGHVVTQNSVVFYAADTEQSGLMARQREIENIEKELRALSLLLEEAATERARAQAAYEEAERQLPLLREAVQTQEREIHASEVELTRLSEQHEQARSRYGQIETELSEIATRGEGFTQRMEECAQALEALDARLAEAQSQQSDREDTQSRAQSAFDQAREARQALEQQAREARFAVQSLQARHEELARAQAAALVETEAAARSLAQLLSEMEQLDDAAPRAQLQEALSQRKQAEDTLSELRAQHQAALAAVLGAQSERKAAEGALDPLRESVMQAQLKEQAAQLSASQFEEQLTQAQAQMQALAQSLDAERPAVSHLQRHLEQLRSEIEALGAVNLAALEELGAARDRKVFLDAQSSDLNEAIGTLEDAIRKIDRETRELIASTYEQVNTHFGKVFPILFGGGTAKLVMTGEEILDAGVIVTAQPPGKKNQSIQLLSGGEKALTAIALIFAIFQLNPAPFCLLDEVDAPLDDANTERYIQLVAKMSDQTQFLFISHNKISMALAHQLIGVTMQEQGVSRIVAVDMNDALTLAQP